LAPVQCCHRLEINRRLKPWLAQLGPQCKSQHITAVRTPRAAEFWFRRKSFLGREACSSR
jgi:hypothetical protein